MTQSDTVRTSLIVPAGEGRIYDMRRMQAVFKADGAETAGRFSISEWWLDPQTRGPGTHEHEDDHIFYVIEGSLSFCLAGIWSDVDKGGYAIIPGGIPHDFQNRGSVRSGFISFNVPGGFETKMEGIAAALSAEDLRLQRSPE